MKDELGDRFKAIEHAWKATIPSDSFMVIRVDGRAFHTWTRGLDKPFDIDLMDAMDITAQVLCEAISGTLCGYVQSDEISIITTDLALPGTQAWFGGVVQKVASVAASIATQAFAEASGECNNKRPWRPAHFDARVFPLGSVSEVADYLWWRQSDARRNSVSMLAEYHLGKKAVHKMTTRQRVDALVAQGVVVDEQNRRFVNGALIRPTKQVGTVEFTHKVTKVVSTTEVERTVWVTEPAEFIRNWFYDTHQERFAETPCEPVTPS